MNGIIYMATNIANDKCYIGQTIQSFNIRINSHINEALREADDIYFHKAIRKYGKENFRWELIAECNSLEELNRIEIEMIKKHNTFGSGYNLTEGGAGHVGHKHTERTRKKLSKANKGKNNPNYGKHHTKESKRKISEANRGRLVGKKHPSARKYIITTPDGEKIFVYGLGEFCRNYKAEKLGHTVLMKVAKGLLKQHRGYKCEYYKGEGNNA